MAEDQVQALVAFMRRIGADQMPLKVGEIAIFGCPVPCDVSRSTGHEL